MKGQERWCMCVDHLLFTLLVMEGFLPWGYGEDGGWTQGPGQWQMGLQQFHSHVCSHEGRRTLRAAAQGRTGLLSRTEWTPRHCEAGFTLTESRVEWPLGPRRGCDLIWIFVRPFRELKLSSQGWVSCAWALWWRALSGLVTVATRTDWDGDWLLGHQKPSWFYT